MGHGRLGTASPPSLPQTMGGARSHPSMAGDTQDDRRGGGFRCSGTYLGRDLHMTPMSHLCAEKLSKMDEILKNGQPVNACKTWYSTKYQIPGPGGHCSPSKGPVNQYQAHPVLAATVTTPVAYTANIGVTQQPRWSHESRATTEICQYGPGFPKPQSGGESRRVLPGAHHVHFHDASPEWLSRTSSSIRDRASRQSSPSPYCNEGHAHGRVPMQSGRRP